MTEGQRELELAEEEPETRSGLTLELCSPTAVPV